MGMDTIFRGGIFVKYVFDPSEKVLTLANSFLVE